MVDVAKVAVGALVEAGATHQAQPLPTFIAGPSDVAAAAVCLGEPIHRRAAPLVAAVGGQTLSTPPARSPFTFERKASVIFARRNDPIKGGGCCGGWWC